MAGIKYLTKKDKENSTNWLWVIGQKFTWLIGYDFHFHGIEIYNCQKFTGRIQPEKKQYRPEEVATAEQVIDKLIEDLRECKQPPNNS